MWIVIPLIYVMSWRFCKSFRQAFEETVAWTVGYLGTLSLIMLMDMGGVDGVNATLDSPGVAIAMLGGFGAMFISHIRWKRRGGDPVRPPGKWARAFGALRGQTTTPQRRAAYRPAPPRPSSAPPPGTSRPPVNNSPVYDVTPSSSSQMAPVRQAPAKRVKKSAGGKFGRAFAAMINSDNQSVAQPTQATQSTPPRQPTAQQPLTPAWVQAHDATQNSEQISRQPSSPDSPEHSSKPMSSPQRPGRQTSNNNPSGKYVKASGRALGAMFRGTKNPKR